MAESERDILHRDRRTSDEYVIFLDTILASIKRLDEKVDAISGTQVTLMSFKKDFEAHLERETQMCRAAFPNGDPDGHRRAHEARIREVESKAVFWEKMRVKAGELTVWAFLFCLVAVIAFYWNGHMPADARINIPLGKP